MNYLLDLLRPENIIYELNATSKEETLKVMVDHAVKYNILPQNIQDDVLKALLNREKSMSTGIGSGVAIPHCSINLIDSMKCVIGISKSGIDFDSIDLSPVHIFVMLLVPKDKFQEHIKTLALIAKTLNVEDQRKLIINAKNFEEIRQALLN